MQLDLMALPKFLITIASAQERHQQLNQLFTRLGFTEVHYVYGEILDKTHLSFAQIQRQKSALVAQAHIKALQHTQPPFLILEDDVAVTEAFQTQLVIPDDADALYLGSSVWGMLNGVSTGNGTRGEIINDTVSRVHNMLGIHAVVYLSKTYVAQTIANLRHCIALNRFCDECIAEDMLKHRVYCVNRPYFYQNDGHNKAVTSHAFDEYLHNLHSS